MHRISSLDCPYEQLSESLWRCPLCGDLRRKYVHRVCPKQAAKRNAGTLEQRVRWLAIAAGADYQQAKFVSLSVSAARVVAMSYIASPPGGPGTVLSELLYQVSSELATGLCGTCAGRSAEMDEKGPEWCEQNVQQIVGWLEESAAKAMLPFSAQGATILVNRAIAIAKANTTCPSDRDL